MKQILLLYIFSMLAAGLQAQQKEFIFKNFTQEEGLPSNEAYYVFEDSKKYLWIGTDNGVVRYNGNKFEQFDLPDNVVFQIREDRKGRIWFFTHTAQLAYFENEKIHHYKYNHILSQRIHKIHIKDARVDEGDNIILSSSVDSNYSITPEGVINAASNKIGKYNSNTIFNISILDKKKCFTQIKSANVISTDSIDIVIEAEKKTSIFRVQCKPMHLMHFGSIINNKNDVYFFAGKYVFKFSTDGVVTKREMPEPVLCLNAEDEHIWVGLKSGGAYSVNEQLKLNEIHPLLPGKSITAICKDYEGGLWITSLENGLYYIKNRLIKHLQLNDLLQADIPRLLNISDSILLFANFNGLYSLSDTTVKLVQQYQNYNVSDLVNKGNGKIYFFGGTYKLADEITKKNEPHVKKIFFINTPGEAITIGNDSFVLSVSEGVIKYRNNFENGDPAKKSPIYTLKKIFNKPAKLYKGIDNIIWCGANTGLYNCIPPYDTILPFLPSSTLLKNGISCVRQLQNGVVTVGLRSKGIAIITNKGQVTGITEKDGLLSNKVRFILTVGNKIWAATTKGISVIDFSSFDPAVFSITNISKNDGIFNIIINQLITYKNQVVAATSNGIYFIENTNAFFNKVHTAIPFYINNINFYNGDTTGISTISLPYTKSRLVIKYSAVSFNAHEKLQYSYRFNTKDTVWENTTNTERIIENLEPGTYQFQIRASIPDQQRFSAIQSLIITIEKPWWQNNWFRLFIFLFIASIVYFFISHRIKKIKTAEKKRTALNAKLAELEQTALRSQMNPHFIFNCLTSIQQLIISGNKIDANEYLVKFSRLIRKTLDLSARPFISIREEKEYLEEYLRLEQLRLSEHFEYSITTDSEVDTNTTLIPNMMIQPIVENCIRHGIKPLENKKGMISIQFERNKNSISCIVTDNGIGRKNTALKNEEMFAKHKSYGMDIVRKRLETFSEFETEESGIEIKDLFETDGSPAGTQVILQLPFKKSI